MWLDDSSVVLVWVLTKRFRYSDVLDRRDYRYRRQRRSYRRGHLTEVVGLVFEGRWKRWERKGRKSLAHFSFTEISIANVKNRPQTFSQRWSSYRSAWRVPCRLCKKRKRSLHRRQRLQRFAIEWRSNRFFVTACRFDVRVFATFN